MDTVYFNDNPVICKWTQVIKDAQKNKPFLGPHNTQCAVEILGLLVLTVAIVTDSHCTFHIQL